MIRLTESITTHWLLEISEYELHNQTFFDPNVHSTLPPRPRLTTWIIWLVLAIIRAIPFSLNYTHTHTYKLTHNTRTCTRAIHALMNTTKYARPSTRLWPIGMHKGRPVCLLHHSVRANSTMRSFTVCSVVLVATLVLQTVIGESDWIIFAHVASHSVAGHIPIMLVANTQSVNQLFCSVPLIVAGDFGKSASHICWSDHRTHVLSDHWKCLPNFVVIWDMRMRYLYCLLTNWIGPYTRTRFTVSMCWWQLIVVSVANGLCCVVVMGNTIL